MHFDLNDYFIPPEAVGRSLTLVASDTDIRILDGAAEIARHHRSYDRQQSILDPAHEQALLRTKRKALHQTRAGRLALAVPKAMTCWSAPSPWENRPPAKPPNCSVCWTCMASPPCAAPCGKRWSGIHRAPLRSPSCCVETIALPPLPALDLSRHPEAQALDVSRHPEAQALDVRPHDLETYDELAHSRDDDPEQ